MTRKFLTIITAVTLTFTATAQTIGTFARKQQLGNQFNGRSGAGMVAVGNDLYIYGGVSPANHQDFAKYNLTTGTLTKLERINPGWGNPQGQTHLVGNYIYHFSPYDHGVSRYNITSSEWEISIYTYMPLSPENGFVIGTTIYLTNQIHGVDDSNSFYAYDTTTNTFTQKANYPGPKTETFAFAINGKGYLGGGRSSSLLFHKDLWEYNPTADTWTQKADCPTALRGASAAVVNNKAYVGLGSIDAGSWGEACTSLCYEYNPATYTWAQKQNYFGLDDVSGQAIADASAVAVGNNIYIYGGTLVHSTHSLVTNNIAKYNTQTNEWSLEKQDVGGNRAEASGVMINGKLYAGGGMDNSVLVSFYSYDPATDNWTKITDCPTRYYQRNAVALNGKGYFIGGYKPNSGDNSYSSNLWEYNPANDTWTQKADYPGGKRSAMGVVTYNGKIYAGLGFYGLSGNPQNDFYRYDPATNSWTQLADAPYTDLHQYISSFVIGDYAYFIRDTHTDYEGNRDKMLRYSFTNNTWETVNVDLGYGQNSYINSAFAYNGKGYYVTNQGGYQMLKKIMEFNPTDNSLTYVGTVPFGSQNATLIPAQDGVYFAFGETLPTEDVIAGNMTSNQLFKWTPNPAISTATGIHTAVSNNHYYYTNCTFELLTYGEQATIADGEGKLFFMLKTPENGLQGAVCIEVNSINESYRILNLGSGSKDIMFANKSFLVKSGSISDGNAVRLYFTNAELNDFVNAFNTKYNLNKTIENIRFLTYMNTNDDASDHSPLNNSEVSAPNGSQLYTVYIPVIGDYNGGKYLEFTKQQNEWGREVYVILHEAEVLANEHFEQNKIVLYPNPVQNILQISVSGGSTTTAKNVKVTDITGKTLLTQANVNQIDMSAFAQGVYLITIETENGIKETKKVIKE